MNKSNKILQLFKKISIILICLSAFITASYANTPQPIWLQESLDKADKLNDKNPALALDFVQGLLKKYKESLSPSALATLYPRLAEYHYLMGATEDSLKYINLYYALSADLTTSDGISLLLIHGSIFDNSGKPKEAMELYFQAERNAKATENYKSLGKSYSAIGTAYSANHNDGEALNYFHQAYVLLKELGEDLEVAYLQVQMARSYSYIYDHEKSISLATEAIEYFNQREYYFDEVFSQNTLAQTYMTMKQYDKAIEVFKRVKELAIQLDKNNLIEIAYYGLARAYHEKKQIDKANHYFSLYKDVRTDSDSPFIVISDTFFSAKLAFADNNIPLAEKYIQQGEKILLTLDKESVISWHVQLLDQKAKIAVFKEDYKTAYELQKEARKVLKSYQNSEREKVRSKYKVMFDIDQALLKNQLLERDKELNEVALESSAQQHKLQTLLTFVISLLALGLILFIYRQRKNSEILHKLANTDTLTELANRRYTFIYAESMLAQAKKNKESFAIIIFDIDHFKKINDTYGHSGGDIALKDIALVANEYVRNNDILGRIGGEEFLVILPNTSAEQALEIAERIRLAIVEKDVTLGGEVVHISASFGISEFAKNQPNFNQIFHEADIALYKAKNSGRNCISLAS